MTKLNCGARVFIPRTFYWNKYGIKPKVFRLNSGSIMIRIGDEFNLIGD